MDALKLNDQEQKFFQDLFHSCDVEGTGKITGPKASELFRTAGLPPDSLHQITELCGAKRLGLFGRSQFYVALKLIAVAQTGLPIILDSIASDVPLPKFTHQTEPAVELRRGQSSEQEGPACGDSGKPSQPTLAGQLPPPPTKKHARSLSGQYRGVPSQPSEGSQSFTSQTQVVNNNVRGESPHDSRSPPFSPKQSPPTSPGAKQRILMSKQQTPPTVIMGLPQVTPPVTGYGGGGVHPLAGATPVRNNFALNSVHDVGWAQFEEEESHGLLGSGSRKSWEHLDPQAIDSSSISSENDSVDDIWSITDEQRDYYVTQFKTMQPDLSGVIKGNVAKEFFEKSRLPVPELSKIWQLSDFNKDGALSLEEFCTAMHLVVLRRNEIELPDHLPPSLMPYSTLINDEPFASDLPPGSTLKRISPSSPSANQWSSAFLSESPSSSDVSSPVIKPVNFEGKPISQDPDIVHPVALRMSPDGQPFPTTLDSLIDRSRTTSDPANYDTNHDPPDIYTPSKPRSNTESYSGTEPLSPSAKLTGPLHGRPRPIPKKPTQVTVQVPGQLQPPPGLPATTSQIQSFEQGGPERPLAGPPVPGGPPISAPESVPPVGPSGASQGSIPPQLPPRPGMHNRSVSVDLKLKIEGGLLPPPAVPPRVSPKDGPKKPSEVFTFAAVDSDRLAKIVGASNLKRFEPIPSQEVLNFVSSPQNEPSPSPTTGQSTLERHRRAKSLDFHHVGVPSGGLQVTQSSLDSTDSQIVASVPEEAEDKVQSPSSDDSVDLLQSPNDRIADPDEVSEPADKPRPSIIALRQGSRDKRDLQLALRTHKERNSMLTRSNSELNQELQEVMEQRIALEIQLEHLRPFSS